MPINEYENEHLILAQLMLKKCILMIVYVCLSLSLIVVGPVYVFIVKNEYNIPSGVILPFINSNTFYGYLLNGSVQTIFCVFGVLALITVELMISIGNTTISSLNHFVKFHLKYFNENLDYKYKLKTIAYMYEDIKMYSLEFNKIFYWKFLLQPIFTTYCVGIGIFCQYQVNGNLEIVEFY